MRAPLTITFLQRRANDEKRGEDGGGGRDLRKAVEDEGRGGEELAGVEEEKLERERTEQR
jgi:hypothetical protein